MGEVQAIESGQPPGFSYVCLRFPPQSPTQNPNHLHPPLRFSSRSPPPIFTPGVFSRMMMDDSDWPRLPAVDEATPDLQECREQNRKILILRIGGPYPDDGDPSDLSLGNRIKALVNCLHHPHIPLCALRRRAKQWNPKDGR
ncbi:hypothetical protein BT93_L0750 [Corymbia citriodora subsp. variegata]|uniref:Uncharacterized protein n=1 Tax=Corymbia citriodora subsp. variegata TaxID=360336 RepID=A0A8T0CU38_CORYI|nr:hypothetical protein BT93_L0750 [Corymbia citriodora subsp. variegata]